MNKLILLFLLLTVFIHGQSYDMNISLKDGSTVTFSVNDIQRIELSSVTDVKDVEKVKQVIESFKVLQNYPNPFNPSTTITYLIPKTSNVKVNIYDVNGRLVKELINQTQASGEYRVTWNGTNMQNMNVSSGVYIYTVSSDDMVVSRKMILLK